MEWHAMSGESAVKALGSSAENGLSAAQVKQHTQRYGVNELAAQKSKHILRQFLEQFSDFMVLILLAAAGVSFFTALLEDSGEFLDPIIILGIVVLNAVIGVAQERRAERSLEALKKMAAPTAQLLRGGRKQRVPARELVPGDIVYLAAGDLVPADARLLESSSLRVQESALTGESVPAEKVANILFPENCTQADRKNMLFASTTVVAGNGRAVVTETGMQTQLGRIAHLLNAEDSPQTPLQLRLAKVGKLLGFAALGICAFIFVLSVLRKAAMLDAFMLSVSLAVAAIPEGLPAIVTVVLSLGVQRMAKSNAIIRHLPAVETLGTATVICSDKTGTLTQNKMTVMEIRTADGAALGESKKRILRIAALCNNATVSGKGKQHKAQGEPTENALLLAAEELLDLEQLRREFPRVSETPFSSERKCMSTVHKQAGGYLLAVKGAPDVLLRQCSRVLHMGGIQDLSESGRRQILAQNEAMASDALRVIAVAYRQAQSAADNAERDLVFCGLIGLQDPPRREVFVAVRTCKQAGITPVMITGDHAVTAAAIAKQLGILKEGERCITGQELDAMPQAELTKQIYNYRVFARVTPEHKVRIVKAFRENGEVVAMTGDGVNDSPALKAADIGCAMGKSGTEVAKSAADMVLTDDNFATIVKAVEQGRGIYDNIKKAVHFLLSCNIGEILVILAASLLSLPTPLLPLQILWVNLVTDSLPAMALGTERMEQDIMKRKPVQPGKSFFADGLGLEILLEGMMIGALALAAFLLGYHHYGSLAIGRTLCFAVLSLSELAHTINMRSSHSIFKLGLFTNIKLTISIVLCVFLQVAVIMLPALSGIFDTVYLDGTQWGAVALLSLAPIAMMELVKLVGRNTNHH